MTLWFLMAMMTAAAIAAVLWPLARRSGAVRSGSDIVVYRDQLDEIERDRAAGLIQEREAEAAKVEVSRRLLAAAENDSNAAAPAVAAPWRRRAVALAALIALPAGAVGLYLMVGSPSLPGQPLAARMASPAQGQSIESLVAQVEEHLQRNPNDVRGWEIIAPVYMRLGRFDEAAQAWRNVLRLGGENSERLAYLGEALVAIANGIVTADAKAAFDRALALDATDASAQFYLGVAAQQDGRRDDAAKIWRDMLAAAPAGAPWIETVRAALARLEGKAVAAGPGPSAADMQAASQLPADQQNAMIHSMVDRLAARLKQDGSDADGWVRLVRSYRVLGESAQAEAAIADARRALAGDPAKLARLEEGLKGAGPAGPPVAAAPGPTTADVQAALQLPSDQQDTMIRGMVARLAARLKQDGSDADGWVRLVRSYRVLGESAQAEAAVADARRALAGDPAKLARLDQGLAGPGPAGPPVAAAPGPSPADMQAASQLPADQQNTMIQTMVARLAARLKQDGSDVDGWVRLVRSYRVLGDSAQAEAAVADARRALADDPEKLGRLNSGFRDLGIGN